MEKLISEGKITKEMSKSISQSVSSLDREDEDTATLKQVCTVTIFLLFWFCSFVLTKRNSFLQEQQMQKELVQWEQEQEERDRELRELKERELEREREQQIALQQTPNDMQVEPHREKSTPERVRSVEAPAVLFFL